MWHAQCSGEAPGCRNKSSSDNCSNDKDSCDKWQHYKCCNDSCSNYMYLHKNVLVAIFLMTIARMTIVLNRIVALPVVLVKKTFRLYKLTTLALTTFVPTTRLINIC